MLGGMTGSWFALQVMARHEKQVGFILASMGHSHFLPTSSTTPKRSDRIKVIDEPLFPGYVFCRNQGKPLDMVNGAPGIIRVVGVGGKSCPVDDGEIEALQRVVASSRKAARLPYLSTSSIVKVVSGPLSGLTGIIVQT
jgi:transcription antitermination factor NusG